jgi:hypothetical protein
MIKTEELVTGSHLFQFLKIAVLILFRISCFEFQSEVQYSMIHRIDPGTLEATQILIWEHPFCTPFR